MHVKNFRVGNLISQDGQIALITIDILKQIEQYSTVQEKPKMNLSRIPISEKGLELLNFSQETDHGGCHLNYIAVEERIPDSTLPLYFNPPSIFSITRKFGYDVFYVIQFDNDGHSEYVRQLHFLDEVQNVCFFLAEFELNTQKFF